MDEYPVLDPRAFDTAIAAVAVVVGPEHRLIYHNPAFTGMFGDRTTGLPARLAFPEPEALPFIALLDDVRATGRAHQVTTTRTTAPTAPERRHFVYSVSPVTTPEGPGILALAIDATAEATTRHRYEALVSAVSQMVWVLREDGSATELVSGWERFTGRPTVPRLSAEWLRAVHPRDRRRLLTAWREALRGAGGMFQCSFRVQAASGEYRHVRTRAVPVTADGVLVEWIGTTSDVEDDWRARLRQHLLAQVADATGPSLTDTFGAMARVVVPDLTDACLILLLPDGFDRHPRERLTATRIAAAARPGLPAPPRLSRRSIEAGPDIRQAVLEGAPRLVTFPAGRVPPGIVPEVSQRWLTRVRATSLAIVPMTVDGTVLAYAVAASCGNSPPPGPADLALLQEVLQSAQGPLRQALDHQQARQTALTFQRAQLTATPTVAGAELAAHYLPAVVTAEVGGDWYDAFTLADGALVLDIGDVVGHDLTAATAMGQMRSMLRALSYNRPADATPAYVLRQLDNVAEGLGVTTLATAVHARLVPGPGGWLAEWSNAGHPPPLLIPAAGPPRYLTTQDPDPPLCVAPAAPRTTHRQRLEPGDCLLLYTDGLVETATAPIDDGLRRLAAAADEHRRLPARDLLARLAVLGDGRDDIAMIAFRPYRAAGRSGS